MNIVYGTPNNDVMSATPGPDWIHSLTGFDIVHGDRGKDIYSLTADGELKGFQDFQDGNDLIDLRAWGITSFDQLMVTIASPEKVWVTNADESQLLYIRPWSTEKALVVDASDFIFVGTPIHEYSTGFDSVNLKVNEYALHFGNGGTNWMNLNGLVPARDRIAEGATVRMDADGMGDGTITFRGVTQHFFDFENIRGTNRMDKIYGDQQDNNFAGLGNGDLIHGGGGNDRIFGNRGADKLFGDDGDDEINGGTGYDQLWGGNGSDRFVFVANDNRHDLVRDFENWVDVLDVSQWGVDSIDDLDFVQLGAGRVKVLLPDSNLGFELRSADGPALMVAHLDNADFIFA